jgi:hypothetical protein
MDATAGDTIAELDKALHAQGIEFCFAELKNPVKDKLKSFGLFAQFGENYFSQAYARPLPATQKSILCRGKTERTKLPALSAAGSQNPTPNRT